MTSIKQAVFSKDLANKKVNVTRDFAAPPARVWEAWTDSKLLDQWWAPKPWKAQTKFMDFKEGGHWLYCMAGPEGEASWARLDYETINPQSSFTAEDAFCDEEGNKNTDFSGMRWKNEFHSTPGGTRVTIEITFQDEADIQKVMEMGFKEGFNGALANLDELLEQ